MSTVQDRTAPPDGATAERAEASVPAEATAQPVTGWRRDRLSGGPRRPVLTRRLADGRRAVLPCAPLLASTEGGAPKAAVVVLLRRMPDPAQPDVSALVERGTLALAVSLDPFLDRAPSPGDVPLFTRSVLVCVRAGERVLASGAGAGAGPVVALQAQLDAGGALAVAAAARGNEAATELVVTADVEYAAEPGRRLVQVTCNLAGLARALAGTVRPLGRADLTGQLPALLADGTVTAVVAGTSVTGTPDGDVAEAVLDLLLPLARPVLRPGGHPETPTWSVSPALASATSITVRGQEEVEVAGTATIRVEVTLAELLAPARRADIVRLLAPGAGGLPEPVPRRVRGTRARDRSGRLRVLPGRSAMRALPLVLTPDLALRPEPADLIASGAVRRWDTQFLAYDVVVPAVEEAGSGETVLSLPLVADPTAPLATDRTDGALRWYVPEHRLVLPDPAVPPDESPYRFDVERTGLVSGSGGPRPGILAELRLRLRPAPSAAAAEAVTALPDGSRAQPAVTDVPSVALEVPFRVSGDAVVSLQRFPAVAERRDDGDLDVRLELMDDWARLAYEALAAPGPAAGQARLVVTTAYRAYVPVEIHTMDLVGFESQLRVATEPVEPDPWEVVEPVRVEELVPVDPWHGRMRNSPSVVYNPELHHGGIVDRLNKLTQIGYVLQTLVKEQTLDVRVPCATHGALYRQDDGDGSREVGCTDVLRLGEAPVRRWRELPTPLPDAPDLRVLASLQQPGMFLVVPPRWALARYGPDAPAGREFGPVAQLYSVAGASATEYHLSVALQPDLPAWRRRDLEDALAPLTPAGRAVRLILPTDAAAEGAASDMWALPAGIVAAPVVAVSDTVRASFSARGAAQGALMLGMLERGGLVGRLTVNLPDGARAESALVVDTRPVGPYRDGPVTVRLDGGTAQLTNRLDQDVDVVGVVVREPGRPANRLPVDMRLGPGGTTDIALGSSATDVVVVTGATTQASPVAELGIFAEDVEAVVTVLVLADLGQRRLRALRVDVRCSATGETHGHELAKGESAALTFTLPLTGYLDPAGLEIRVSTRPLDGADDAVEGPWMPWDLQRDGALVSVGPSMVPSQTLPAEPHT